MKIEKRAANAVVRADTRQRVLEGLAEKRRVEMNIEQVIRGQMEEQGHPGAAVEPEESFGAARSKRFRNVLPRRLRDKLIQARVHSLLDKIEAETDRVG